MKKMKKETKVIKRKGSSYVVRVMVRKNIEISMILMHPCETQKTNGRSILMTPEVAVIVVDRGQGQKTGKEREKDRMTQGMITRIQMIISRGQGRKNVKAEFEREEIPREVISQMIQGIGVESIKEDEMESDDESLLYILFSFKL
jgi:hypothetical protein